VLPAGAGLPVSGAGDEPAFPPSAYPLHWRSMLVTSSTGPLPGTLRKIRFGTGLSASMLNQEERRI
jgi:hypothetical protein